MSEEDFADLVGARRVSRSEWIGRCPAHRDDRENLVITKGYKRAAQVKCLEGCSVREIRKSLGLTRHEFECWPAPRPNLLEMSEAEVEAFRTDERERQGRHAAACERIRTLQEKLRDVRLEIRTHSSDELPKDLKTDLDKIEQKLSAAQALEIDLRDLDPSFQLWDAEDSGIVIRSSGAWLR